jgi:TPR repeat protein
MVTAKEYFENYLAWERRDSNLRSASVTYVPYSSMELEDLTPEAEAGNPAAQEELGERYLFGIDLKQDADKALELFRKAGEAGNPEAMHMEAEVYRTEEFGHLDYDKYFVQLKKAAEAGSWKSMFNLACAYYKGKEAYEGHGFEVDRMAALKWSTQCSILTMELLEFDFTHNCDKSFEDYMQGVYALFVQSICVSARQLIRGDGVPKDVEWAKTMLGQAQSFYRNYFKADCPDFTALLNHC